MDTDKLRYFSTVAETGSLTKASQLLGISHSGISKALSALEQETKTKLFRPQGRGLEITPEGRWFYQKAQEILKIADEVLKGKKANHSLVRIGISGVIVMTCSGLLAEEAATSLTLYEIDVGEVEGKIIADELDFGFVFNPAPKPELEYLEIGEVRFSSHAREDLMKRYSPDAVPYAVPISDFPFNPLGYRNRDGWPNDVPRTPHFSVSGFAIALNLLRAGQAAIYMPDFVASLENSRLPNHPKIVPIKEHKLAQTRRRLFLVKRQSAEESVEMKKVTKVLRGVCCTKS